MYIRFINTYFSFINIDSLIMIVAFCISLLVTIFAFNNVSKIYYKEKQFFKIFLLSIYGSFSYCVSLFILGYMSKYHYHFNAGFFFNIVRYSFVTYNPIQVYILFLIYGKLFNINKKNLLINSEQIFLHLNCYFILYEITETCLLVSNHDKMSSALMIFAFIISLFIFIVLSIIFFKKINKLFINFDFPLYVYYDNENLTVKKIFKEMSIIWLTIIIVCSILKYFNDTITIIILIIFELILFYKFFYKFLDIRIKITDYQLSLKNNHMDELNSSISDYRGIKHDFYNLLQVYDGYIELGDYHGLEEYHRKFINKVQSTGDPMDIISKLQRSPEVYGLFMHLFDEAKKKDIDFKVKVNIDITTIIMENFDFCRVMGIIINNAIEAAENTIPKMVSIYFDKDSGSNGVIIVVENSTNNDVDIDKIFAEGYTTKQSHMGQGLNEVKKIFKKYPNSSIHPSCKNGVFYMYLTLKK